MDYFLTIWSVIVFVENRLRGEIRTAELERATGFSLAHIRSVFKAHVGMPLNHYICSRKIANAAFDLINTQKSILEISLAYRFNPDTFTKAFKRVTGCTPQAFRRSRRPVGRIKLCAGVYRIGIFSQKAEDCL